MATEDQSFLFENLGFTGETNDQYAHDLFWSIFYDNDVSLDDRLHYIDDLQAYLQDTYGVDFLETWDWDDFRSWYDAQ